MIRKILNIFILLLIVMLPNLYAESSGDEEVITFPKMIAPDPGIRIPDEIVFKGAFGDIKTKKPISKIALELYAGNTLLVKGKTNTNGEYELIIPIRKFNFEVFKRVKAGKLKFVLKLWGREIASYTLKEKLPKPKITDIIKHAYNNEINNNFEYSIFNSNKSSKIAINDFHNSNFLIGTENLINNGIELNSPFNYESSFPLNYNIYYKYNTRLFLLASSDSEKSAKKRWEYETDRFWVPVYFVKVHLYISAIEKESNRYIDTFWAKNIKSGKIKGSSKYHVKGSYGYFVRFQTDARKKSVRCFDKDYSFLDDDIFFDYEVDLPYRYENKYGAESNTGDYAAIVKKCTLEMLPGLSERIVRISKEYNKTQEEKSNNTDITVGDKAEIISYYSNLCILSKSYGNKLFLSQVKTKKFNYYHIFWEYF